MKPKYLLLLLFFAVLAGCRKSDPTQGEPEPPAPPPVVNTALAVARVFQNNMVLQRDKPLKIWGTGTALAKVTVKASWLAGEYTATANSTGNWEVSLPASAANATPQTINISAIGTEPIALNNILIGDVWLCAGQSNMVMPVGNVPPSFAGVENYTAEINAANYPLIRSMTVPGSTQMSQQTDFSTGLNIEWKVCLPTTVADLSSTAYFFARKMQTTLNVPIGVIIAAVNGSWCENWLNKDAAQTVPGVETYLSSQTSTFFNGMLNPLTKLSIKGFTWYQGENDQKITPVSAYTKLNTALVKGWRNIFAQGDLPFYYVQLTPFDETNTGDNSLNWLAYFREAQANVRITNGTGMVVTMDAGEVANHHPKYKKQVGERLALLALSNTYGYNVQSVGPQYQSFSQAGNKVIINFINGTANGLNTINNEPIKQYFFLAGADHIFRPGTAEINGDKIMITVPSAITNVLSVRYAFSNFPVTNLQNSAGLPMEPFRTDDWGN